MEPKPSAIVDPSPREYQSRGLILSRRRSSLALGARDDFSAIPVSANVSGDPTKIETTRPGDHELGRGPTAGTTGVAERATALAWAIAEYTRRLAGEVDTDDAASVAAFQKAMRPSTITAPPR